MTALKTKNIPWQLRARPKKYEVFRRRLARKIRVEVINQGLAWHNLADKANLSFPTVRKFLEYKTGLPNIYTIWKMANALGIKSISLEAK